MSCWVVPTIAADLWGISVQQILDGVKMGNIPSKSEAGFTFIDVAPNSPKIHTPKPMREPSPPTYTVVTPEELAILRGESGEEQGMTTDWRSTREKTESLRRRPMAA